MGGTERPMQWLVFSESYSGMEDGWLSTVEGWVAKLEAYLQQTLPAKKY
jgi:hypothetical protein